MARGGKRTPSNPYQQSGEGRYSKRTDGKAGERVVPSGGRYGDRKALETINQQGSVAAAAQAGRVAAQSTAGDADAQGELPPVVPMPSPFSPSARPGEPLTAGSALGPGPGPSIHPDDLDDEEADIQTRLQVLYGKDPNPHVRELLEFFGGS